MAFSNALFVLPKIQYVVIGIEQGELFPLYSVYSNITPAYFYNVKQQMKYNLPHPVSIKENK